MGFFDDVPVVSGVEDAAGTAATGAVDTFVADPGNALLGVDSENQGLFEPGQAGSKLINIGSFGMLGHGGLISDGLTPDHDEDKEPEMPVELIAVGGGLLLVLLVVSAS